MEVRDKKSKIKDQKHIPNISKYFSVLLFAFFIFYILFFVSPTLQAKPGATLFLDPEVDTVLVEEVKAITLKVNTGPDTINAIEATVSYPTHQIEIVSIAKGPLLKIWAQEPTQDAQKGTIKFAGGIPNPGFKGAGEVLVLKVKARVAGDIPLVITSGAVLANDGKGTNVLSSLGGGLYRAEPRQILPQIIEEPQKGVELDVVKPPGAIEIVPSPIAPLGAPVSLAPSIVTVTPAPALGVAPSAASAPAMPLADQEPPQSFVVQLFEGERTACITPTLMFQTSDAGSGLARYTVSLDDREFGSIDSSQHTGFVKLSALEAGQHTVVVLAHDRANNTLARTAVFEIVPTPAPKVQNAPRRLKPEAILQVWGATAAGSTVEAALAKDSAAPVSVRVLVNREGAWNYVHPDTLEEGRYMLTLVTRDRCGAVSAPTTVKFRVTSEGYFAPITKSFTRAVEATPAFFQPITSSFQTVFSDVADWLGQLFRR